MKKVKAPLFKKLTSHYESLPISFHIPGHKMGKGFNPLGKEYYRDILKLDMTEIVGLDDLHQPQGVILDAEEKAAKVFKAGKTFFLVNGSTSGNLAMILATCNTGDKIIVQKNAHKSVINGILLARAIPIYLNPETITQLGVAGGINEVSLIKTLETTQNVKAVFITNPNYYGISMNIEKVIEIVHGYQIPLLVDEAHGAHFGLHSSFPNSAIQMGADIVVQSTHKTLSAMTMGSMLHVNSKYIDIDRLRFVLSMVQTSSPSYPIMASLDLTCEWIESKGEQLWTTLLEHVDQFYQQATILKNINVIRHLNKKYKVDPLKIIIHSINNCYSGVQIQKSLEQKKIYTELADLFNTLAVVSLGTSNEDLKVLLKSLIEIDQSIDNYEENQNEVLKYLQDIYSPYNKGQEGVSLDRVLFGKNELVSIKEAIGGIATEMVIPYPPGIPLIQIGEKITTEYVEHIIKMKELGIKINGLYGADLDRLKIIYNSNTLI